MIEISLSENERKNLDSLRLKMGWHPVAYAYDLPQDIKNSISEKDGDSVVSLIYIDGERICFSYVNKNSKSVLTSLLMTKKHKYFYGLAGFDEAYPNH